MKKIILAVAVASIILLGFTLISTVKKSERIKSKERFVKTEAISYPEQSSKRLASWD